MAGLEISEAGVLICKDYSGRPSGEAYVEILNEDHFEAAVEKHNENMGHRWGQSTQSAWSYSQQAVTRFSDQMLPRKLDCKTMRIVRWGGPYLISRQQCIAPSLLLLTFTSKQGTSRSSNLTTRRP